MRETYLKEISCLGAVLHTAVRGCPTHQLLSGKGQGTDRCYENSLLLVSGVSPGHLVLTALPSCLCLWFH